MPNIIIRVQLHREDNYVQLHAAMAARGFSRAITLDNGRIAQLPTGTYYCSRLSLADAVTAANAAAEECRSAAKIVASDGPIRVMGLEDAK